MIQEGMKTIVVTGCNKGIGFGIIEKLAATAAGSWKIIMACRNIEQS